MTPDRTLREQLVGLRDAMRERATDDGPLERAISEWAEQLDALAEPPAACGDHIPSEDADDTKREVQSVRQADASPRRVLTTAVPDVLEKTATEDAWVESRYAIGPKVHYDERTGVSAVLYPAEPPASGWQPIVQPTPEEIEQVILAARLRALSVDEYVRRAVNAQMVREGVDAVLFRTTE